MLAGFRAEPVACGGLFVAAGRLNSITRDNPLPGFSPPASRVRESHLSDSESEGNGAPDPCARRLKRGRGVIVSCHHAHAVPALATQEVCARPRDVLQAWRLGVEAIADRQVASFKRAVPSSSPYSSPAI